MAGMGPSEGLGGAGGPRDLSLAGVMGVCWEGWVQEGLSWGCSKELKSAFVLKLVFAHLVSLLFGTWEVWKGGRNTLRLVAVR